MGSFGVKIHNTAKLRGGTAAPTLNIMNGPVDRVYHFSDDYERRIKGTPRSKSKRANLSQINPRDNLSSGDKSERVGGSQQQQSPLHPPPGLKNVGNSCYANAALQCLLSTALPHALLSERNAHIIRRHSFNRKLLISGSGSVDSDEDEEGSRGADSVLESYLSGMTGLCSLEDGKLDPEKNGSVSTPGPGRRKKRRDDSTVASYGSLTSDMYHGLKKRQDGNAELSDADLLCLWLTQELTQITREYTTPPQNFIGEKRRGSLSKKGGRSNSFIGSFFGGSSSTANTVSNRVVDPGSITRHVHKISPTLRPYQQEDAHEFFRSLLSSLTMNGQNARLSSLFDGLLESSVTCRVCQKSSLTRDRYMDLSLDIADRNVISLDKALAKFTEEETLDQDNMVTCSRCKVKRIATKGLRLATAPTMLVINYKRFAYDNYGRLSRLSKQVSFPLRLDLKDYMSRANRGKPRPYSLVAVMVHRGRSCDCGHYFAYVRKGQDWYLANDSVVTKVGVDEVLNAQAYVLVYEVEGMKEKHNFDCYSRYHRSVTGLDSEEDEGENKTENSTSWDFSAFTNIFEACEVGLCAAANSVIASHGENVDYSATSSSRLEKINTYEDTSRTNQLTESAARESVDQAYYKRGRSHTPSRQNRKREKEAINTSNLFDFEPRIESHRRAKSVSRVEDIKSSRSGVLVKRFTKTRRQKKGDMNAELKRSDDLPPLHNGKQREV